MDWLTQALSVNLAVAVVFLFFLFVILRQILFFGFTPFLPSRPEVIEKILSEFAIKEGMVVYSLNCGRSGFLMAVEKKYPNVKLVGVKKGFFSYLMARCQVFLKRSRIEVRRADFYKADIREANIVFCYLDVKILREMYKKLKVEPRAGAIIISVGFIIPYLDYLRIIKIEERKRWFSFLIGRHERILTEKEKEFKRDNNVYFYEV